MLAGAEKPCVVVRELVRAYAEKVNNVVGGIADEREVGDIYLLCAVKRGSSYVRIKILRHDGQERARERAVTHKMRPQIGACLHNLYVLTKLCEHTMRACCDGVFRVLKLSGVCEHIAHAVRRLEREESSDEIFTPVHDCFG